MGSIGEGLIMGLIDSEPNEQIGIEKPEAIESYHESNDLDVGARQSETVEVAKKLVSHLSKIADIEQKIVITIPLSAHMRKMQKSFQAEKQFRSPFHESS